MARTRLLCILHRSPPNHGAAKVGDFIASSGQLKDEFECHFITIKSSDTIADIGRFSFKKINFVILLYFRVLWALVIFRPDKIYFTASIRSVAFYRDLLISTLWKTYKLFKNVDVFYHYHTKGVDEFVSESKISLKLTNFFVRNINIVLLSPMLEKDFSKVKSYKRMYYLPNGVEDTLNGIDFKHSLELKYDSKDVLNVLYLSNMIKSKGYLLVLELANKIKDDSVVYHFAGGWESSNDEKEFFDYIEENNLSEIVVFHGFVNGEEKRILFESAHLFMFPTRYKKEAFPLSILEALSYGVPVIATDEASIPYILDKRSGIVLDDVTKLGDALSVATKDLVTIEAAQYCRDRFLKNFTMQLFESNLVKIIKG
ncbi:MAG: glycosyltransferase family 4 protein [Cocleimonas sp.]